MFVATSSRIAHQTSHKFLQSRMGLALILILPLLVSMNSGLKTYPKSYTGYSRDEATVVQNVSSHTW